MTKLKLPVVVTLMLVLACACLAGCDGTANQAAATPTGRADTPPPAATVILQEPAPEPTSPPPPTAEPTSKPIPSTPLATEAAPEPAQTIPTFLDSGQALGLGHSWDVALGDLDNDGDLDAFVANSAQGEAMNAIWLNDGHGTFSQGETVPGYGQGVALGDLDGDGDLDAVAVNWSEGKQSTVWFNDGNGGMTGGDQDLGYAFLPALGDLDGDGDLDLYLGQMAADTVWLNDGMGTFSDTRQRLGTGITAGVGLADLDGDGDLDALAGGWEEAAKVWLNDGAGTFSQHPLTLCDASVHIHDLALGDLDRDGDVDAFMAVASAHPNQVWFNDGSGTFSDSAQPLHSSLAHGVTLGDLDEDGDLDAVTAHGNRSGRPMGGMLWLNDGLGGFAASDRRLGELYGNGVGLGDLDGDGDVDVFLVHGVTWQESGGEQPNQVWLNQTVPSPAAAPALGGTIAFYSDRDGEAEIYTVKPDGTDLQQLTHNEVADYSPTWSPDGRQIAFVSDRDDPRPGACFPDCQFQLYLVDADGSNEHKLVETPFRVLHPDWHPDGELISFDNEFNLEGAVYVVNADGTGLHPLIQDGFWADWSPDGSKLVFASNRDGDVELYVADADGGNQRRLTHNSRLDFFPAWSPGGRRIAFATIQHKQIFVMDLDGGDEQQLTYGGLSENPTWSPDGAHVIFQSSRDGDFELYILDAAEALRNPGVVAPIQLTENGAADMWPDWTE